MSLSYDPMVNRKSVILIDFMVGINDIIIIDDDSLELVVSSGGPIMERGVSP